MVVSANRMTDDFMEERSQAPLDKMKDWVKNCAYELSAPLVDAVQDRIGVAKSGKRLLDDGGEEAELDVLAKKIAFDAVTLDQEIMTKIHEVGVLYREAASLLQTQTSGPNTTSTTGRLIEVYNIRSNIYGRMHETLNPSPDQPVLSDVEWDAVKLIQLRQLGAQVGLQDDAGGEKAERHSSSFFSCVDKERRPKKVETTAGTAAATRAPSFPDKFQSLMQSVVHSSPSEDRVSSDTTSGKRDDESTKHENSQSPKSGDTLETLETYVDAASKAEVPPETKVDSQSQNAVVASDTHEAAPFTFASLVGNTPQAQPPKETGHSAPEEGHIVTQSVISNASSAYQYKPYGNYDSPKAPQKSSQSHTLPESNMPKESNVIPSFHTNIPSFHTVPGEPTTPIPGKAAVPTTPIPAGACPYRVNDIVEVKSKSANSWVQARVVDVKGWVLTVKYGDRERKVDLNQDNLSSLFRSRQQHAIAGAAAFDSMLGNPGGPVLTDVHSTTSEEPRRTKAAVL
jgi:hypothetical protein